MNEALPDAKQECSFCLTPGHEVDLMVEVDGGPSICDYCVGIAYVLVMKHRAKKSKAKRKDEAH